MPIRVSREYKLQESDKETIEEYLYGEINASEAATHFNRSRESFKGMIALIIRHMVMSDPAFAKQFMKQLKDY